MHQHRLTIVRLLLLIIITFFIVHYLQSHEDVLPLLSRSSFFDIVVLSIIWLLLYVISAVRFIMTAKIFDVPFPFHESFFLTIACSMVSFFLPFRAGLGLRGTYFYKRHSMQLGRFAAMMFGSFVITFSVEGIAGFFICLCLHFYGLSVNYYLYIGFVLLSLTSLILFLPPLQGSWSRMLLRNKFDLFLESINAFRTHYYFLILLVLINLFTVFVYGIWIWFGFHALSLTLPLSGALLLGLASTLITMLSLTPGNLGVQEAVMGALSVLIGSAFHSGLIVSILLRAVSFSLLVALGIPSFIYITSILKTKHDGK